MIWIGRRILVTGHTGFEGGYLSLWLARLGAKVYGLALPPETPSLYLQADVGSALSGERFADIREPGAVRACIDEFQPEIIFHLAAQPLVRVSYAEPLETFATNVMGTAHILDAARACRAVRAIVVVTSDKCYDNRERERPYHEEDALGGADPYSASEGCVEILTASWRRSFYQSPDSALIATARAGNVFGGGDWALDRLIPDIARALRTGQPVYLRNPRSVRPWQYVMEPLRGYLLLAARLLGGDESAASAWNFGPARGEELCVRDMAGAFLDAWGEGSLIEEMQPGQVHEAAPMHLDSSKAARLLHWRQLETMPESLRLTVDWYRTSLEDPTSLPALTRRQIDGFQALWGATS